jgi:hypothetical protein
VIINENNKKMSNINSIKELESYINDNIVGRVALISEATSLDSMPIEEFNLKILLKCCNRYNKILEILLLNKTFNELILFGIKHLDINLIVELIKSDQKKSLLYLINSDVFKLNYCYILNDRDKEGWNILYYLIKYNYLDIFLELYLKGYLLEDMFNNRSHMGQTLLMISTKFEKFDINFLLGFVYFNEELYTCTDNLGFNCLHYVCMNIYGNNINNFKTLVKSKYFKKEILVEENMHGVPPILYGFSIPEIGNYILDNKLLNNEELNYIWESTNHYTFHNLNILYCSIGTSDIDYFKRIYNMKEINIEKLLINNKDSLLFILDNNYELFKIIFDICPEIKKLINMIYDDSKINIVMLLLCQINVNSDDLYITLYNLLKVHHCENLLYESDKDGDYAIHYMLDPRKSDIKILKFIYDTMDERVLNILDCEGRTILDCISNMIESEDYKIDDLIESNLTVLDKKLIELLLYILNSKKAKENIDLIRDDIYKIVFKLSNVNNLGYFKEIIKCDIFSDGIINLLEITNHITDSKETILDYVNHKSLKYLLDNSFINESIFNNINDFYYINSNYFLKYLYLSDIKLINVYTESKYFNEEIFHHKCNDENMTNCMQISVIDNIDIVMTEYLLNHDYFNLDDLNIVNGYNQNILMRLVMTFADDDILDEQHEHIEYIFDKILSHDVVTNEFIDICDNFNTDIFSISCIYSEYISRRLLNDSKYDNNNILRRTSSNITVLQLCLKHKNKVINDILNMNILTNEIINNKDNYGNNIFHFILNTSFDQIELIFNKYNVNKELLINKNCDGSIPFILLGGVDDLNILRYIFDLMKDNGKELFKVSDNNNIDILKYALLKKKKSNALDILSSDFMTKDLIFNRDKKQRNTLFYFDDYSLHEIFDIVFYNYVDSNNIMITDVNNMNILFYYIKEHNYYLVNKILNSDLLTQEIFEMKTTIGETLISLACKGRGDILNEVLEHKLCNVKYLKDNNTYKYIDNFGIILRSKYNLDNYFINNDPPFMISLLYAHENNFNNFKEFMKSKYFLKELLFEKDLYGHNILVNIFICGNIKILNLILEKEYFNELLNDSYDIDNEPILMFICEHLDILKMLLKKNYITEEMYKETNTVNNNIFHLLTDTRFSYECFVSLTKSAKFKLEYLFNKNIYGDTFLHECAKHNEWFFFRLLEIKNFLTDTIKELLKEKNNLGETVFLVCCKYNEKSGKHLLKCNFFTNNMIIDKDLLGNNCLNLASNYPNLIKDILNHEYFSNELLENRNIYNETAIFNACRMNGLSTKYILDKETNINNLTQKHSEYNTALIVACKNNLESVRHILSWEYYNDDLLLYNSNNKNILQIICENQYMAFNYILDFNCGIEYYIYNYEYNTIPPIDTLIERHPNLFRKFMNSKYGGKNFLLKNGAQRNEWIIDIAYDRQPQSLLILLDYYDYLLIKHDVISNLIKKINKFFNNINNLNDLKEMNLLNNENIYVDKDNVNNCCNICYSYEATVIFLPCYHKSCISCSIKINKCHICRHQIESRKYIY